MSRRLMVAGMMIVATACGARALAAAPPQPTTMELPLAHTDLSIAVAPEPPHDIA
jgi:hypothetical protein